jgi:VTC domain-containing protein
LADSVNWHELATHFAIAHPALADSRSLQHRVDRKFLLAERNLASLLPRLQASFSVLPAGRQLWARYESIYFDTTSLALFHAHRCDRRPRVKVRIRRHLDRQLAFLEVKRKAVSGRTKKYRLSLPLTQSELCGRELEFIAAHTSSVLLYLMPTLAISFARLTLVASEAPERLTLDRALTFAGEGRFHQAPGLVVGEVKQEQFVNRSGSISSFRIAGAREVSFSKYCIGTVLLRGAPAHVFKPGLRAMARLTA